MKIVIIDDDDFDVALTEKCIHSFFASNAQRTQSDWNSQATLHVQHYTLTRFTNGDDFLEHYDGTVDLIFLDIELPGTQGVDVARHIRLYDSNVTIVFTTKMAQYAAEGYDVDAIGYLIKPFSEDAFRVKMVKAFTLYENKATHSIPIRTDNGIRLLHTNDIEYIDVQRHEVTYHTTNEDITVWSSLKAVLQLLAVHEKEFIQVNRYTLVNLGYVRGIEADTILLPQARIPTSRGRRKAFMEALTRYTSRNSGL
ncbi:LytR/AlgR family response regulator transcription factor [Alloscardovia macacae]|nr:LytTR family DNA-binding domain-containing protein [Alloscardovia macacae]